MRCRILEWTRRVTRKAAAIRLLVLFDAPENPARDDEPIRIGSEPERPGHDAAYYLNRLG